MLSPTQQESSTHIALVFRPSLSSRPLRVGSHREPGSLLNPSGRTSPAASFCYSWSPLVSSPTAVGLDLPSRTGSLLSRSGKTSPAALFCYCCSPPVSSPTAVGLDLPSRTGSLLSPVCRTSPAASFCYCWSSPVGLCSRALWTELRQEFHTSISRLFLLAAALAVSSARCRSLSAMRAASCPNCVDSAAICF